MGEKKRRMASAASGEMPTRPAGTRKLRFGGIRITWKAVGLFMLLMVLLDLIFYAIFHFGFGSCYGVLCLLD